MLEMAEKEKDKDATIELAQLIYSKCHPDAVTVIRHWITIIQSRWDEVFSWARQREQKLATHIKVLKDLQGLLEELMRYLTRCEDELIDLEQQELPDDLEIIEHLIKEHQV